MADPLSVAGLVTGVISLGLQVAGGLTDYLDAVKGRSEDLRLAKQGATEMRDLLLTIQDLLPGLESDWPVPAATVKRRVQSCNSELGALYTLLSELSNTSPSNSSLRSRFENTKKKLIYPFSRSQIREIEDRITRVNSTLQTALQVAELNVAITSANQIQNVHGLLVSLSGSQTSLRTQSVETSMPLTMSHDISGLREMGHIVSSDSIHTAMSLASKPSLLSSSIRALEGRNPVQSQNHSLSQTCLCRPAQKIIHHRQRWGDLSFLYQLSTTTRHLPDCPLSQIDTETQATKVSIEYFGLQKLLQTAFGLSIMSTRGAGGRSISPGFTYYPTVDSRTAPAFRIISIVTSFTIYNKKWDEAAIRTVQSCYDAIFQLFTSKKASPKDLDSHSRSLIHEMWRVRMVDSPTVANASDQMIMNLIACGVPVTTHDSHGFTPAMVYLEIEDPSPSDSTLSLVKRLLPKSDTPLFQNISRPSHRYFMMFAFRGCLEELEIAEASGCGPLSLAARVGDEELVQELVTKYPQSLGEKNDFGCTPLHFAIAHPQCLRVILEAAGSSILGKPNPIDGCFTALDCACILGYATSAQILLAAGSQIDRVCILWTDVSCLDSVLVALKRHRDELKQLALEHLSRVEAEQFGLHEEAVLDGHALGVHKLLLEKGIHVPSRLCGYLDPVYSLKHDDRSILDWLWALGFQDVDSIDEWGDTPITGHYDDSKKVRWLIEHGADYQTPFNRRTSSTHSSDITATPAHFVSFRVGDKFERYRQGDKEYIEGIDDWRWLFQKVLQVETTDTCLCPCSKDGCTPLKAAFDWHRDHFDRPSIQELAQWCVKFIGACQSSFDTKNSIMTLRRMTFDGLELKHSCCRFCVNAKFYPLSRLSSEGIDELILEQESSLCRFEDLYAEFDAVAHEDRDGVPLIVHDPQEFWMHRWLPRMEEVLNDMNGDNLTMEERLAAEAIGVKWGAQQALPPAPIFDKKSPLSDYFSEAENVLRELKEIMDE